MQCPFCQNWQISRSEIGRSLSVEEMVQVMLELQEEGAENINFVTGSHFSLLLAKAVDSARQQGMNIPVLWNSSAYESLETLKKIASKVDIWLPDLKTLDPLVAEEIYGSKDYPHRAKAAVEWMVEQGPPQCDNRGKMLKGTIVRHLILPGELQSTRQFLEWFGRELKDKAWLSLLSQYTPVKIPGETRWIPKTYLSQVEYEQVLQWLDEFSIEEGFIQDLETGSDWLPDFKSPRPFSADLAKVIRRFH